MNKQSDYKLITRHFMLEIPKNYILRSPLRGSLIAGTFTFLFLILYRPQLVNAGHFPYFVTAILYSTLAIVLFLVAIHILNLVPRYRSITPWTLRYELESIFVVLFIAGSGIYLAGFITEGPADRLNLSTYLDSLLKTYLIGCIPYLTLTAIQVHQRLTWGKQYTNRPTSSHPDENTPFELQTPLKQETLRFIPADLIYASAEGNYVNFVIAGADKPAKHMVRCTLNSVDEQLAEFPYLFRAHRAYIVNLKKVVDVNSGLGGNHVTLNDTQTRIPIARSRVNEFKWLMKSIG